MKKLILISNFILLALLLCACKNNSNHSENQPSVTVTPVPTEATVSAAPTVTAVPTISPTKPAKPSASFKLLGYTPLGVKVMQSRKNEENTDYIYINSNEGWKAVYDALGMFKEDITLYKTSDSGNSWSKLTSTEDKKFTIPLSSKSGLIFVDSLHGWLTTEIPQSGFIGLYKTKDGGVTWTQQKLNIPKKYSDTEFSTYPPVFFTSKDALLLTYSPDFSEQLVFVTHDGGASWKQIKEKEDDTFQWGLSKKAANDIASGWTIQYNHKTWSTSNAITWEAETSK